MTSAKRLLPILFMITIHTGSRLHLGIFSEPPPSGRLFRGCGLMIDAPGFHLSLRPRLGHTDHLIDAPTNYASRIKSLLHRLDSSLSSDERIPVEVALHSYYSPHTGLGSGTQLAMAIVDAWSTIHEIPINSVTQAMDLAGRGERSSIGSTGYFQGGFLIDDGKPSLDTPGSIRTRYEVPGEWRVLLFCLSTGIGLAGTAEKDAFAHIDQVRHPHAEELSRCLDVDLPLALTRQDFHAFSTLIDKFGQLVGTQFSSIQGGIYASRQAEEIVHFLREQGLAGIGQSSWGPTLFAFCPTEQSARKYQAKLATSLPHLDWQVTTARPLNTPAAHVLS